MYIDLRSPTGIPLFQGEIDFTALSPADKLTVSRFFIRCSIASAKRKSIANYLSESFAEVLDERTLDEDEAAMFALVQRMKS